MKWLPFLLILVLVVVSHAHGSEPPSTNEGSNAAGNSEAQQPLPTQEQMQDIARLITSLKHMLWVTRDQLREVRHDFETEVAKTQSCPVDASPSCESQRVFQQIERKSAAELDVRTFFTEYALKSKPVIITGLKISTEELDVKFWKEKCGDKPVNPRMLDPKAKAWGRLIPAPNFEDSNLAQFIEDWSKAEYYPDDTRPTEFFYLHDWNIPIYCPEALEFLRIPRYFTGDFLQRIPDSFNGSPLIYVNEWPSLFIGPKGSQSAMHVDSFGSNFWMYLISGKKKWHIYHPKEKSYLYEDRAALTFDVDSFSPNFTSFPLFSKAVASECVLEQGEVLYVPAGSPHQVLNIEDTMAVSMNYIDVSNIQLALNEIERASEAGEIDNRILYAYLRQVDVSADMQLKDLSYADFKTRWRKNMQVRKKNEQQ